MNSKQLKYLNLLSSIPDCPKSDFCEIEGTYYRWVRDSKEIVADDFVPMNIMADPPPRILDNSDLLCKGYGLSFFDTNANAFNLYRERYQKGRNQLARENFVKDKGTCIAGIKIEMNDGVADKPSSNGHFTFHEYENCELTKKVLDIFNIFDSDGNIKVA